MPEELNQPPDPVLRFRMRTMIAVMTALAILAAIAGPYYRSIDQLAGRQCLLLFWSIILLSSGISFWLRVKESWHVPKTCRVRYVVFARGKLRKGFWSTTWSIVLCILLVAVIAFYSYAAVIGAGRGVLRARSMAALYGSPFIQGILVGSWAAALIFSFVRRPMFICEEGIPLGKGSIAPWKYIRHAEWQTDRPETLKLHRLDGDIYLDVPNGVHGEVEAFVCAKTRFVEDDALPPV